MLKINFLKVCFFMLISIVNFGCSVFGIRGEEQLVYEVITKKDDKEIRLYKPYISAQTTVEGSYKNAQNEGFRIVADYIFGNNIAKQKIAMTAPVTQSPESKNEKISMTAPVLIEPQQTNQTADKWTISFSMPSKYTLETLPTPVDSRVVLKDIPEKYFATKTFSGFWSEEKNQEMARDLEKWLAQYSEYTIASKPIFAGYNPPWTIPFLRRNEVLLEIIKTK